MKKISIITINYNNYEGLVKTAESVVCQTFKDIQYIIIDGGSTDGSKKYIESISQHLDYWVSEPDKGIFNAMNKGIEKATGDYLLFLNSGDCLNGVNALEKFISHQDFKGDIIYGDYKSNRNYTYPNKLTSFHFVINSLPHQATFFKNSVFETFCKFDEKYKISSDKEFFLKCLISNKFKFQHIKFELTIFDLSGISNINEHLRREEDLIIFQENFGVFYEDYLEMEKKHHQIIFLKHWTIKGIFRRFKRKLKLWN